MQSWDTIRVVSMPLQCSPTVKMKRKPLVAFVLCLLSEIPVMLFVLNFLTNSDIYIKLHIITIT